MGADSKKVAQLFLLKATNDRVGIANING